jgi:transposase
LQPRQSVLADKAYDADWIRNMIWDHGTTAVIPSKSNQKIPKEFDAGLSKKRNPIDCFFG